MNHFLETDRKSCCLKFSFLIIQPLMGHHFSLEGSWKKVWRMGREKKGRAGTTGPQHEETGGGLPRPRGDSRDDTKDRKRNTNEM